MASFCTVGLLLIFSIFNGSITVNGQYSDAIMNIQPYFDQLCPPGSKERLCSDHAIITPRPETVVTRPTNRYPSTSSPSNSYPSNSYPSNSYPSNIPPSKRITCSVSKEPPKQLICNDNSVVTRERCGFLGHTNINMPIHRRNPWVRAIYKDGQLHCTATLVSSRAVVTAAHCLTPSKVQTKPDPNLNNYLLELPGPDFQKRVITLKPKSIHIHPHYSISNNGNRLQHDLAVMFFNFTEPYKLPTVCIVDQTDIATGNEQWVFNMNDPTSIGIRDTIGDSDSLTEASWRDTEASLDKSCIMTSTANVELGSAVDIRIAADIRIASRSADVLKVQNSQFCASHKGRPMVKGSSGGPYLVEVGEGVEEVWVLMGVLSSISDSSSQKDHLIFEQVADDDKWIKHCVFDDKCTL